MDEIKSSFQFIAYKIDHINFDMYKNLSLLLSPGLVQAEKLNIKINIRQPQFDKKNNFYIGGLNTIFELPSKGNITSSTPNVDIPENLFTLTLGIAGVFRTENRFEENIEKNLVKHQIPALLFPYIRSMATNVFANAGFGSVILPLINIHQVAVNTMKNIEINVIE